MLDVFSCGLQPWTNELKDTKPYMSAFLSVDLLTDFAAFCLKDFIDWRYINSWFVFLTQLVNWTVAPMDERTILVYCCPSTVPSLWPPPPSPPSQCTVCIYRQCVTWGWGVEMYRVRSHAPSIRSHRGTKVVWPDFQPMRVPEEPVCIELFR